MVGQTLFLAHLGPIWCIIKSLETPESQIPAIRIGAEKPILNQFSKKSCHSLARLSYDINSTCAGKPRPGRVEWWVKLYFRTIWGRHGGFWSRWSATESPISAIQFDIENFILTQFSKKIVIASRTRRKILFRRALESPDPGASNGGSNFIFGPFGADMEAFEVAGVPQNRRSPQFNLILKTSFWPNFQKKLL